ncbi:threonine-phosphate decarboxylase CobD [Rhizobium sp. L1K21]|uniref:threonine-phosphate decarboxylase CobD n=1 Tax=Rhizobium sp. L1K21 TaxID=2954933 RepID=UPI002091EE17|nr:threonine-phosphate decarboxylase CobD [Rhizobium sp. L1K21]MCO6185802.1 threonine-phosphate decarboxylase CobD [Rhizobium sp. L1K21]
MTGSGVFHGGGIDAAAARYGRPVEEWLDLSTGINPCAPPLPDIPASVWQRLPDSDLIAAARHTAARYYGSGAILPIAAGGTQMLIRALANRADVNRRIAVLAPTYGEYQQVFADSGFAVDFVSVADAISPAHGLAVIVNPNNPDGRVFSRDELLRLCERLSETGTILVVDEAFADLEPALSMARATERFSNLVVLRSFGKFFGYAGLRLAFAISGDEHGPAIERILGPWPVSGPALVIADALMRQDHEQLRLTIRERRAALETVLEEAGFPVIGGTDLFALIGCQDARAVFEHLAGEGILTRAFDYRPDWLRVGLFARDEDGLRLLSALKAFG